MAVLDEGLDAAPVEGDGGRRSFPATVADRTPGEWRSLYERQHARADRERTRADAAEARCEDLRWAEVASRSDAGWWKSRFKACRRKLSAAEDEMKELRRAARDVSSLRAEAARLEILLSQAVGPSTGAGTIEALSKEVVRLRTALASSQARGDSAGRRSAGEARRVRTALEEARQRKDAIGTLRKEVARLNKEVVRRDKAIARLNECLDRKKEETERIRETAKKLSGESLRLHREARILGDAEARSMLLSGEVLRLRHALDVSAAGQEKLKARLVKLRAAGATRSKLPFDEAAHLRTVLRRSPTRSTGPASGRASCSNTVPACARCTVLPRGWSHVRRDFIDGAAGQVALTQWCQGWTERIASIYRLNAARLAHYDPGLECRTPAFDAAQGALKEALGGLFAEAGRECASLPDQAREGKALRSLLNHRAGLSVFVDRPQVPMDNNPAERILRGPSIGRRLSFGSDSKDGAKFTAIMYSVAGTLALNGIDVLRWLEAWLESHSRRRRSLPSPNWARW